MKFDFAIVIPMANESDDFSPFISSLTNELNKLECGKVYFVANTWSASEIRLLILVLISSIFILYYH